MNYFEEYEAINFNNEEKLENNNMKDSSNSSQINTNYPIPSASFSNKNNNSLKVSNSLKKKSIKIEEDFPVDITKVEVINIFYFYH